MYTTRYGDVCETAEEVRKEIKDELKRRDAGSDFEGGFSIEVEGVETHDIAAILNAELKGWMWSIKRGKSGPEVLWVEMEP